MIKGEGVVLFVMPRSSRAWSSAGGLWIAVAGWADAAKRQFGESWIITPDRIASPEEALAYANPSSGQDGMKQEGKLRTIIPKSIKTAVKDAREFIRRTNFNSALGSVGRWDDEPVVFVWQQHDLFPGPGHTLARRLGVPFVSFVHAPQVWEGERWGVKRPVWGRIIESRFESPDLRRADMVACVSEEVGREVRRLGVQESRIVITPTGVDASRFSPSTSGLAVRTKYDLRDSFVFGWTGSFRKFHGLEIALHAFSELHVKHADARLLLVGDGLEKARIQQLASSLGIDEAVIFTGAVSHLDVPHYIAAMDATLVTARDNETFHYSPQKLREYMLCAKPVIVPSAGEMDRFLKDRIDSYHYTPGSASQLREIMDLVISDREQARMIGTKGYESVYQTGTWHAQLLHLVDKLNSIE